jgi:hypothetical protein
LEKGVLADSKKHYFFVLAGFVLAGVLVPIRSMAQQTWMDSISVKGDVRLRYEGIDEDGEEERNRGRFRARLGITADVNDNVTATVQFASGGDNPVSTNQTFADGFSRKDIGLDLAYLQWVVNDYTKVYGGKMKNPFHRAGGHALVWDGDMNPEGAAIAFDKNGFFGNAGLMFVEERSSADDSLLIGLQGGYVFDLSEGVRLTTGVTYYDYTDTEGNTPFYNGRPRGNSSDIDGNLIYDYNQFEVFAEMATTIGGQPLSVFVDYVSNGEADSQDTGFAFGAAIGKASAPGTWQASIAYQDLEADAVIATFTDSDFGGGGTGASGFILKGKYALADNWAFGGTLFLNEIDEAIDNEHDYSRLQIDLEFKF